MFQQNCKYEFCLTRTGNQFNILSEKDKNAKHPVSDLKGKLCICLSCDSSPSSDHTHFATKLTIFDLSDKPC